MKSFGLVGGRLVDVESRRRGKSSKVKAMTRPICQRDSIAAPAESSGQGFVFPDHFSLPSWFPAFLIELAKTDRAKFQP